MSAPTLDPKTQQTLLCVAKKLYGDLMDGQSCQPDPSKFTLQFTSTSSSLDLNHQCKYLLAPINKLFPELVQILLQLGASEVTVGQQAPSTSVPPTPPPPPPPPLTLPPSPPTPPQTLTSNLPPPTAPPPPPKKPSDREVCKQNLRECLLILTKKFAPDLAQAIMAEQGFDGNTQPTEYGGSPSTPGGCRAALTVGPTAGPSVPQKNEGCPVATYPTVEPVAPKTPVTPGARKLPDEVHVGSREETRVVSPAEETELTLQDCIYQFALIFYPEMAERLIATFGCPPDGASIDIRKKLEFKNERLACTQKHMQIFVFLLAKRFHPELAESIAECVLQQ